MKQMEKVKTCGIEIDFDKQDGYFINADCVEGMKAFPDNYFDLAITDPPYGAGFTEGGGCQGWFSKYHQQPELTTNKRLRFHGSNVNPNDQWYKYTHDEEGNEKIINWDVAPDKTYFDELFRVSKNQIIWGGNYFDLPPTRCFLVWKKLTISESFSMAMAEYAWTSFNDNAKVFECAPQGKPGDSRFHPTQKPVALYEWILNRYAKEGDIILDTHVGSASSLIACRNTNHKFVGFEIDKDYYGKAKARLDREIAQMNIFDFLK